MRIVLDARTVRQPQTGIGRSVERLGEALAVQFPDDKFLFVMLRGQTPPPSLTRFPNVEIDVSGRDYQRHGPAELWLNGELIRLVERWRGEVLHGPAFLIPWRRTPFARVATIMDLIAFRMPENYPPGFRMWMKFITRRAARAADAIIIPSQFVANELAHFIIGAESKAHVVPLGPGLADEADAQDAASAPVGDGSSLPKPPYFLFVGTLERRKDLRTVLQAFTIARQRDDFPHRLVISGAPDKRNPEDVSHINRHPYREAIVWLDKPLGDAAMRALYRGATALTFASRCEGFGLPLVEAMREGAPVVAAEMATAPEICSDAALYFKPATPSHLAEQWRRIVHEAPLGAALAQVGRRRAEAFTWTRSAKITYDVYRKIQSIKQ